MVYFWVDQKIPREKQGICQILGSRGIISLLPVRSLNKRGSL